MRENGVDVDLTLSVLRRLELGDYSSDPVNVADIPGPDDPAIIDCAGQIHYSVNRHLAGESLKRCGARAELSEYGAVHGNEIIFDSEGLRKLGESLSPLLSYGVLNGGSATSYADGTKNRSFHPALYAYYSRQFERLINPHRGKAKGLTPAFVQPDSSPGPSFLELKMRGLLVGGQDISPDPRYPSLSPYLPMFQMTSSLNTREIAVAFEGYRASPYIQPLNGGDGCDVTRVETAVQPLITAFTSRDRTWSIFSEAFGEQSTVLPLPGGHGQCFVTLKPVFSSLYDSGKRFVLLGNVDNIGNLPKPEHLAILALSGAPAGFEFAYRTAVDVKGGILVRDDTGRLTCADIGPAISVEEVAQAEKSGARSLFNCATGIFSLEYLMEHIDTIIERIPLRISRQYKDAGEYYQAEQITWEVMSLMDNPIILGVNKFERFLAAKLFIECLLTSGVGLEDPEFPGGPEIYDTARSLSSGLEGLLERVFGLKKTGSVWSPD